MTQELPPLSAPPVSAEIDSEAEKCVILAALAGDPDRAAELQQRATRYNRWALLVKRLERALDEIVANAAEDARLAEQNPGRGHSPAGTVQRVAPSAGGSDRGSLPHTIDQVIAAAHGDSRVIPWRPALRVVRPADTEEGE